MLSNGTPLNLFMLIVSEYHNLLKRLKCQSTARDVIPIETRISIYCQSKSNTSLDESLLTSTHLSSILSLIVTQFTGCHFLSVQPDIVYTKQQTATVHPRAPGPVFVQCPVVSDNIASIHYLFNSLCKRFVFNFWYYRIILAQKNLSCFNS